MNVFLRLAFASSILLISSLTACKLSAQENGQLPALRAVYANFHPYSFLAEDGTAKGYSIDLTRQIAQYAGYDVEFVMADNPQQFFEMMGRGEVDLSPLLGLTETRRDLGLATPTLGQFELSVYVRSDSQITTIEELSGHKVGSVTGAVTEAAAERIPLIDVVPYQSEEGVLLPLLNGEVEAVVGVAEPFDAQLRQYFIKDKVRRLEQPLVVIPYGLIVRSDLPEVHRAFEQAIAQRVTPSSLAALRTLWFGQDISILKHPWFKKVALIVSGIGIITISLAIYAGQLRQRSAQLLTENGENGLLVNALDQIRAGVVIFDKDMRAVHWNKGFEGRFPALVPLLCEGATMEQFLIFAYSEEVILTAADTGTFANSVSDLIWRLRKGMVDQGMMRTTQGDTFDRSIFQLGTGHYASIWVDVSQLHNQQERIKSQSRQLERKNQQLLAFSSMAAHDLKAPLAQQSLLLEFFMEDLEEANIALPSQTKKHLEICADLTVNMGGLVEDLLDYARADTPQASPKLVSPRERMDAVLMLLGRTQGFEIVISPNIPNVWVDPNAFDMVMRNLMSNAIKHNNQPNGRIELRGTQSGGIVTIEVEDNGPGIAAQEIERVFEPFCRLTKTQGTGLGLALVKSTVSAWGGDIALRPASGGGCIFALTLPAAVAQIPLESTPKAPVSRASPHLTAHGC
ncbi:MAG: transporter substrate-binding domain-containing protein [Sulfitobacter sp.]